MKKYIFSALILTLAFALTACDGFSSDNFVDTSEDTEVEDVVEDVVLDPALVTATDAFFDVLLEDKAAAYATTHEIFKTYTTEEEFVAFMGDFPVMTTYDSYEFYAFSIDGTEAEMNGFIESAADGTFEVNFLYDQAEDGTWLVSGFDINLLY